MRVCYVIVNYKIVMIPRECRRYSGHLSAEDHHRVIAAALRPPSDWKRPASRPRTTWLRTTAWEVGRTYSHRISGFTRAGIEEGKGDRYLASGRQCGNAHARSSPPRKVKGLDIYIPPLTGKPWPAAVYN